MTATENPPHIPVLVEEVLDALRVDDRPDGRFVDGTLGAGGHAAALLAAAPQARLLGLDRDPVALALAQERLAPYRERVTICHASYEQIGTLVSRWMNDQMGECAGTGPPASVDGILFDLGISSMQVDDPARGFAFRENGPLDMRFDPAGGGVTAADVVNTWDEEALADILYRYGEERHSRRIARAIIARRETRPLATTRELAEVVLAAYRGPRQKIHPATRTFQALRIVVNDELVAIERVLPRAIDLLRDGGRLAVISFHSLEDRIVKTAFKLASAECICPSHQPICTCNHVPLVRVITRKPVVPTAQEVDTNPRARSAKMRVVERFTVEPAGGV